jgi:hypothetical protein
MFVDQTKDYKIGICCFSAKHAVLRRKNKYCFSAISQFSILLAISWREQVNFQTDDDEVRFELYQRAKLDIYSASSLKQQSCTFVPKEPMDLDMVPIVPTSEYNNVKNGDQY